MFVVQLVAILRERGWGGGENVLMGVSAEAFCTVTTLPPTEQAAAESREQLTGHQISQSLSLENAKKNGQLSPGSPPRPL